MIGINKERGFLRLFLITCVIAFVFLFCSDSMAMEGPSKGRKIWDLIMLWVNFGILVFLFIKFAKDPLMNFLRGEREKIEKKIKELDGEVSNAKSLMETEANKLEGIDDRVKAVQEQIIELGHKEKNKIIEKAKNVANKMIEDAKKESKYKLETAKKRFGQEMLDIAVSIAVQGLQKEVSQEDDEKIIDEFSIGLSGEKGRFA